ncbi:sensor histidine kinase [Pseudotenacibaculum haliotis]|uniref:Oxygen sensor histidine kinase NreB n=1 Tax=Pseudotenacibaculum haliotis TaxID=1862138 RepID=A0ABW5LV60_9FLAO
MFKKIKKKLIFIGVCILSLSSVFSQKETTEKLIIGQYFEDVKAQKELSRDIQVLNQILYHKGQNKLIDSLSIESLAQKNTLLFHLCKGFYNLYNQKGTSKSFPNFNQAYLLSKEAQDVANLKLCLLGFLELYSREIVQSNTQFKSYLDEFALLSKTIEDKAWLLYYTNFFNSTSIFRPEAYYESSKQLIPFVKKNSLSNAMKARFYEDIGLYYNRINKADSAQFYYEKVIQLPKAPYVRMHKFNSYLDLAELSSKSKRFLEAKKHFQEAQKYYNRVDSLRSAFTLERFKAIYFFEKIPRYDSAYHYLKASILKEQEIGYRENSLQISELNVQLGTAQKEKEILEQKHEIDKKQRQKTNILIGSFVVFLLGSIIVYIIYKNVKRKQLIAEQEKEIQSQKAEKILKDQELSIINAMIEGQEKERKELAEELHDNVASTLASANMQLDYFIKNKNRLDNAGEILEKAALLIGNAYNDVHDMAHKKNSGVIAQKGLLSAIRDLANNVSVTNKIHIDIKSSDIKERINNALEITIFRIIQELVNNIVKHANAKEVLISVTFYDGILGLIIEDNGIGFHPNNISKGMGLNSIETRVEALEGSFEIDSTEGRGTTVLIDIPIT